MLYLIIAHYNNNLKWIKEFIHYKNVKIIIYSKSSNPYTHFFNIPVIKRLNAGREGETYINYIINNYKKLNKKDYTIFLQDDPFEHQPNIINILKILIILDHKNKLPLLQPLNSHAYQDIKKDMINKNKIISGDIFSYNEYKNKKKLAAKLNKKFFNNYPPKLMNKVKTHSIFIKKKQIAQINILFLNWNLESILIPDSNPFIWHLYKSLANYLEIDINNLLKNNLVILPYIYYIFSKNNKIKNKYLKRIINTKYIPYNPSAQFVVSNKLILENDLFVYQNIQKILLDPKQPILPQKVRLNGFILEFIWLFLFNFKKYYKNNYTIKQLRFYKKKNAIINDINYYRKSYGQSDKYNIITINKNNINNAKKYIKYFNYLNNSNILQNMKLIINENNKMKNSNNYNYYKKI